MDASRYPDKEYQLEWIRIYLEEWNKHNKSILFRPFDFIAPEQF
jgi:hypothetical protein